MEANELRVGNLLLYKKDQFSVLAIKDYGEVEYKPSCGGYASYFIDLNDCEPIPLTEEWLKKFGFVYDDNWHWTIGQNPLTKDYMLDLCWIEGSPYPFYRNGHFSIRYVHQLQNLYFALTGEELELND